MQKEGGGKMQKKKKNESKLKNQARKWREKSKKKVQWIGKGEMKCRAKRQHRKMKAVKKK